MRAENDLIKDLQNILAQYVKILKEYPDPVISFELDGKVCSLDERSILDTLFVIDNGESLKDNVNSILKVLNMLSSLINVSDHSEKRKLELMSHFTMRSITESNKSYVRLGWVRI